jgi:hypothetical protein
MERMRDFEAERERIRQSPPPELVAEAAANPGGSVASIDSEYIGHPDGFIPGEAIQGVWLVDADGNLTGEFKENPDYGPPKDEFAKLTEPDHWLGWLGDDPAEAVRDAIADCLHQQAPNAVLEWVKILETPRFFTGGRPSRDDENAMLVTRAGLAVSFALSVTSRKREILTGVFSWVAVRLDQPGNRIDQVWLDLWTDLDWAEEELRKRIYAVGQPAPDLES